MKTNTFISLLGIFLSANTGLALPASGSTSKELDLGGHEEPVITVIPLSPEDVARLNTTVVKRDWCYSSGTSFEMSDANFLVKWMYAGKGQTVHLGPNRDIGPYTVSVATGSVQACIYNWWDGLSADIDHWEIGWGADYVLNSVRCCDQSWKTCPGGECQVKGTNDLTLDLILVASSLSCNGRD